MSRNFTPFPPKCLPLGYWVMYFTISYLLTLQMLHRCTEFCTVLEKKMLIVDGQQTTDEDRRQPMAIGYLSDPGDLIKTPFVV